MFSLWRGTMHLLWLFRKKVKVISLQRPISMSQNIWSYSYKALQIFFSVAAVDGEDFLSYYYPCFCNLWECCPQEIQFLYKTICFTSCLHKVLFLLKTSLLQSLVRLTLLQQNRQCFFLFKVWAMLLRSEFRFFSPFILWVSAL